jgi:hypothetical protein
MKRKRSRRGPRPGHAAGPMAIKPMISAAAGAAVIALAVAGCATAPAGRGGAGARPARAASPASPAPSASAASGGTAVTPQQRAAADAASILASFVPPRGAVRLTAAPAAASALARPPAIFATADVADRTSWWRVPGQPQAVLAWEAAHLPSRFTAAGRTTAGSPPSQWSEQFTLPAVTGVLSARSLLLRAVSIAPGQTALRVDAEVTWIPVRPASERVPAAARAVTVAELPGLVVTARRLPAPVTITDPARVRELIAATDALPPQAGEHVLCPAGFGNAVRLTFSARPGGPALAVAEAGLSGCGLVSFSVNGVPQPALSDGPSLAREALALAGLGAPSVTIPAGGRDPVMRPGAAAAARG